MRAYRIGIQKMIASERIHLRASQEAKQMIEQAAAITGTTLSAFMLQHAYEKAVSLITQHQTVMRRSKKWEKLSELLENPNPANDEIKALMASMENQI